MYIWKSHSETNLPFKKNVDFYVFLNDSILGMEWQKIKMEKVYQF